MEKYPSLNFESKNLKNEKKKKILKIFFFSKLLLEIFNAILYILNGYNRKIGKNPDKADQFEISILTFPRTKAKQLNFKHVFCTKSYIHYKCERL